MYKYLNQNYSNLEELKKHYKELAKKFHPDYNENGLETMKIINNEYEVLFNQLKDHKSNESSNDYITIIDELLKYNNIEIEVIGTWLWLHGQTYVIKEEIKKLGFQWSKGKKLWYKSPSNDNGKNYKYKQNSLDAIRSTFGSQFIKGNNNFRPELT